MELAWSEAQALSSAQFTCGYCGCHVATNKGWDAVSFVTAARAIQVVGRIRICHQCTRPTFIDAVGRQYPGSMFGDDVSDVPEAEVGALYDEARNSIAANCFTASVLCCRKLMMHVAVEKGAPPGRAFVEYVQYLVDNHYVPGEAKSWLDHVRKKGNEANHEIHMMQREDAEELVTFCAMLLKSVYEFPAAIAEKGKRKTT